MTIRMTLAAMATTAALAATPALAQQSAAGTADDGAPARATAGPDSTSAAGKAKASSTAPKIAIQHLRPADQRGIDMFEPPKDDGVPFTGFRIDWGAAFTQQFQSLRHSNTAAPKPAKDANGNDYDANRLADIGWGANLPTANLFLNAQLAPGIRVALESYLSSRHHQETWVKGGYLLMDESPIDNPALSSLFKVLTVKVGMFPLDYGDAIYRRSDNGQALQNPFVGNLILDAWTFEPGAEVYARKGGLLAMVGVTTGQNKGDVTAPEKRSPAFLTKVGVDRRLSDALRVRLTGSVYRVDRTPSATLFWGDRAGSHYFLVMENTQATPDKQAWSGALNPGFTNQVRAVQINPFVKYRGLELFGVIERAEGKAATEATTRTFTQYSGEVVYRFLPGERVYVGGRYNTVAGTLPFAGTSTDVGVDRAQLSAGWFVTPTVLLKGEYVTQTYRDFPSTDIRNGGKFSGFVMEGVVAF